MQRYKAIFFDLDGTLLSIDADFMIKAFFVYLREFLERQGYDAPERVTDALGKATREMALSGPEVLNEDVFWEGLCRRTGIPRTRLESDMVEFYRSDFNRIGSGIVPNPAMQEAVSALRRKGYALYLTTMPLFPQVAIEHRLLWAGIDPGAFMRITTYSNSYMPKPDLDFFRQNIEAAGVEPHEVLIVGNHTLEDLSATLLGCDAFLVTDMRLEGVGAVDWSRVTDGSSADFLTFVDALPPCKASGEPA